MRRDHGRRAGADDPAVARAASASASPVQTPPSPPGGHAPEIVKGSRCGEPFELFEGLRTRRGSGSPPEAPLTLLVDRRSHSIRSTGATGKPKLRFYGPGCILSLEVSCRTSAVPPALPRRESASRANLQAFNRFDNWSRAMGEVWAREREAREGHPGPSRAMSSVAPGAALSGDVRFDPGGGLALRRGEHQPPRRPTTAKRGSKSTALSRSPLSARTPSRPRTPATSEPTKDPRRPASKPSSPKHAPAASAAS